MRLSTSLFFTLMAVFCLSLGFSGLLFAQDAVVVSDGDILKMVFELVTNFKSYSPYVIAFAVTKILIACMNAQFFGKFFSKLSSQVKIILSSGLAYVSGVLSLVIAGEPLAKAAINSVVLPLLVAFVHLIYTYFFEKKSKEQLEAKANAILAQAKKL